MLKISEEVIEKIKDIYVNNQSISLTKISEKFNIPRETIRKRLIKKGIYLRSNKEIADSKVKIRVNGLCELYNKVKSLRKVRKITGYSINYIKKCIKGKVDFPIYPRPLKHGYEKISKEKVRIYAHTIFDGHISHSKCDSYTVGYTNKKEELLNEFRKDVENVYGLKSGNYKDERGITYVYFSSKLMYYDLLNFNRSEIEKNIDFIKIYLRAFFDDEGCVNFNPTKGKFFISGSQYSTAEIKFVKSLLDKLNIKSNLYGFIIEISKNESIFKYHDLIGFTNIEKKNKLLKGITYYRNKFHKINNQNLKIKQLTQKGLNPYQISDIIKLPPSTIRNRVNSGFKMNKYDYFK